MWRQRVPLTSICKVIHSNASSYLRCLLLPALKLQSNRGVFHALYARIHIIDKEQCKATVVFEASWINCIKVKNRIRYLLFCTCHKNILSFPSTSHTIWLYLLCFGFDRCLSQVNCHTYELRRSRKLVIQFILTSLKTLLIIATNFSS